MNNVLITAALSRALDKISVEQAAILFIPREGLPRSLEHPPSIPLRIPLPHPSLSLFRRVFIRSGN